MADACPVCTHPAHGTDTCHAVGPSDVPFEVGLCECAGRTAADTCAAELAAARAKVDALALEVATLRALEALRDAPTVDELHEPGRAAFEAYNVARGGKTHDGKPTPAWDSLGDGVRAGWMAAAVGALATLVPDHEQERRDAGQLAGVRAALGLDPGADVVEAVLKVVTERAEQGKHAAHLFDECKRLQAELATERATPPGSKLEAERKKREHFRAEMACLRRWYAEQVFRDNPDDDLPRRAPDALDLFAMYPDHAPGKG